MKHLPTETVIEILGNLSKPDLKTVGLVATRYSALARPFLFKRIRVLFDTNVLPYWVTRVAQSADHAPVIKVIEIGDRWSRSCLQRLRSLVQSAVTLEQLVILAPNRTIPLELLDPLLVPNLRKLAITANTDYDRLAVDFLPHCPHLVDLEIPHLRERWAWDSGFAATLQHHAPSFMDRLRRFRGPPYFLSYMSKTDRALQHFSATISLTDAGVLCIGKELGFGEELLSLHVVIAASNDSSRFNWVERHCITPSLIPPLFPNLRSVAWFPVHHQLPDETNNEPNTSAEAPSADPLLSPNAALLAVIKQLPHLRRLCLVSYHCAHDGSFPEVITAFVTVLQNESDTTALPHLHTLSIWAGGSEPWSYSWRKRYIDSPAENGRSGTRTDWFSATNQIVNPDRESLS